MASIGGSDQFKVLRHLDPVVLQANPKASFGYSDNTNLLVYLWNLGIIGFHGGSTIVIVIPYGGSMTVDGSNRTVTVTY
jgi:muramoyltetrapeptide carboxypeptidase LdcA involved in peptidoglycan recycling